MQNLKPLIFKWVVFLLLCRRPLAADGWCPAGGVWPCQEGWSGQAGCDQGAPDLLSASDLTRLTSLLLRGEHTKGFVWKMTAVLCFQDAYLFFSLFKVKYPDRLSVPACVRVMWGVAGVSLRFFWRLVVSCRLVLVRDCVLSLCLLLQC